LTHSGDGIHKEKQCTLLPWGKKKKRHERYSETALSEAHYSGGYLYIKINRLGWAEHVILVDNNRAVKKVFNTKPVGIRKTGRPKLRWEDDVIQDIKTLGVKNWRNIAMEKESCQKLLRKARAHTGLSSQL
jgi:hypothetical protein